MEQGDRGNPPGLISPLQSIELDLPPSCIEFCSAYPEYLVIGTYNLQQDNAGSDYPVSEADSEQYPGKAKAQSRSGSLVVYRLRDRRLYVSCCYLMSALAEEASYSLLAPLQGANTSAHSALGDS